jgi:hypothetical protein
MTFFPDSTADAALAPPQANPESVRGTVCYDTERAQMLDAVDAHIADLRARLDAMMAECGVGQ